MSDVPATSWKQKNRQISSPHFLSRNDDFILSCKKAVLLKTNLSPCRKVNWKHDECPKNKLRTLLKRLDLLVTSAFGFDCTEARVPPAELEEKRNFSDSSGHAFWSYCSLHWVLDVTYCPYCIVDLRKLASGSCLQCVAKQARSSIQSEEVI